MTQAADDPVLHILWMNGGLSCDGDSVALTAATQPSIEEIVLGALPGLPKVAVHWPLIDFECGPEQGADNFIEWWHKADRGELDPFVLVVEGSIPNEAIKSEGYWCGFGNNPATGQPMTTSEWLDRLAPKATAILAVGTCATYGGIHAMAGNPTGAMGVPDYLGWDWKSKAGLPIVCVPGCPIQPDNLSETILYLLYQVAGQAPMIPLDEALRPKWLFEATVHQGCDRAGVLRGRRVRHRVRLAELPGQAGLLGTRGQVQRAQARLDQRRGRLPQRRRHLHRLHHARLPGQVHAVHGQAAGRDRVHHRQRHVRDGDPQPARLHRQDRGQGTEVAREGLRTPHRLPEDVVIAMTTVDNESQAAEQSELTEMTWDPITRIVGSLGIYTKIDFKAKRVAECHSTSSIFRGYSIFMKGKDPRDAHFITSRICGICGDNHATCSVYNQNMAYGVRPPHLGEWIINLGEAAEYMFDHNIFQENLVGVDFCERMVAETNPGVLELANSTQAPHAGEHGYRTIGDIMRSLNPLEGEFYREALQVSRSTREMFCLMEGRHVHPSTLYPGGVGTVATVQLFTDYLTRLMRYVEFMKRVVPMHDDLFDFFYEALPGYEEVGRRRVLLGCWGSLNNPEYCDFTYRNMADWGRKMFVTPGVVVDGKLVTTSLVDINLGIRILLGHSFYEDWEDKEMFVTHDELGNPVDRRHPWNQHTIPKPAKRDFDNAYSWTMSPRWFDGKDYLPLDTGGGPIARLWATALAGLVDCGYVKSTGHSVQINLPRTMSKPETTFEWKIPVDKQGQPLSNAIERDRARTYFQAYSAARGAVLRRAGAGRDPRRADQDLGVLQRARRTRSAAVSPRPCAACCRTTW